MDYEEFGGLSPDRVAREEEARRQYLLNHQGALAQQQSRRGALMNLAADPKYQAAEQAMLQQRQMGQLLRTNPKLAVQLMTLQQKQQQLSQGGRPQVIQTASGPMQLVNGKAVPILGPGDAPVKGPERADKPMTEFQGKAALYGTRMQNSHGILNDLEEKISTTGLAVKRNVQDWPVVGGILGAAGNAMLSKEQQAVEQAQRDFVNATLRQESGAVINPNEFENATRQYFPQPGDSPALVKQKRDNRELAIKGFERMSGKEGALAIQDIRSKRGASPDSARPRATNPQTGETLEFDGKQWVPAR